MHGIILREITTAESRKSLAQGNVLCNELHPSPSSPERAKSFVNNRLRPVKITLSRVYNLLAHFLQLFSQLLGGFIIIHIKVWACCLYTFILENGSIISHTPFSKRRLTLLYAQETFRNGWRKVSTIRATSNEGWRKVSTVRATLSKGWRKVSTVRATLSEGWRILSTIRATSNEGWHKVSTVRATYSMDLREVSTLCAVSSKILLIFFTVRVTSSSEVRKIPTIRDILYRGIITHSTICKPLQRGLIPTKYLLIKTI
jgi:hypothetical protein